MPAQKPYRFRYVAGDIAYYQKSTNLYCIKKVHKDYVFFRCKGYGDLSYAMPMPDERHFDRLVLPE